MKVSWQKSFVVFVVFAWSAKLFYMKLFKMALFKYGFKSKRENSEVTLLDPFRELSKTVAPSAIVEANSKVKDVLSSGSKRQ